MDKTIMGYDPRSVGYKYQGPENDEYIHAVGQFLEVWLQEDAKTLRLLHGEFRTARPDLRVSRQAFKQYARLAGFIAEARTITDRSGTRKEWFLRRRKRRRSLEAGSTYGEGRQPKGSQRKTRRRGSSLHPYTKKKIERLAAENVGTKWINRKLVYQVLYEAGIDATDNMITRVLNATGEYQMRSTTSDGQWVMEIRRLPPSRRPNYQEKESSRVSN